MLDDGTTDLKAIYDIIMKSHKQCEEALEHLKDTTLDRYSKMTHRTFVKRHLISTLICIHFQRPSVAENLTVGEFVRGNWENGAYCVTIKKHKTDGTHVCTLALDQEGYPLYSGWLNFARGNFEGIAEHQPFFCNEDGSPYQNLGREVDYYCEKVGIPKLTSTSCRKTLQTLSAQGNTLNQTGRYLCHRPKTAEDYYVRVTLQNQVKNAKTVKGYLTASSSTASSTDMSTIEPNSNVLESNQDVSIHSSLQCLKTMHS